MSNQVAATYKNNEKTQVHLRIVLFTTSLLLNHFYSFRHLTFSFSYFHKCVLSFKPYSMELLFQFITFSHTEGNTSICLNYSYFHVSIYKIKMFMKVKTVIC